MNLLGRSEDDHAASRLGVLSALLEGDAALASRQALDLLGAGIPFDEVLFDVLVPIQGDVGRRWAVGDYGIGDEHAISAALENVISILASSLEPVSDGAHVVVASAESDTHALPARVLSAYLTYCGFRVTNLGATVPAAELGEFLELHRPAALVLTCSMAASLVGARRCIAAAHAAGVPVVCGGRAFGTNDTRARVLGADAWLSNPRLLDGLLARWEPDIEDAEAGAVDIADHLFGERWSDVGGIAETVAAGVDGVASARAAVRIDAELFAATLDASLLVDDPGPVVELATWHHQHVTATGRPSTTAALLGEMEARWGASDPRIGWFLGEAAAALEAP